MKPYFIAVWLVVWSVTSWFLIEAWSMLPCYLARTCALGRWIHGGYMVSSGIAFAVTTYNVWRSLHDE